MEVLILMTYKNVAQYGIDTMPQTKQKYMP